MADHEIITPADRSLRVYAIVGASSGTGIDRIAYLVDGACMHYLLIYDVAPDYLERRAAFRDEHLALAWQAHDRGELLLGGALADPVDGAVLVFQGDSPAVAEQFAAGDPYVRSGLVTRWQVRPWTTVVGELATSPLRPAP